MQNGMSADDAAKRYFAVLEKGRNSVPKNIPTFLGGGGGTPGGNPNPAKMSSKDRRNYVVEMLNAVNNQNK